MPRIGTVATILVIECCDYSCRQCWNGRSLSWLIMVWAMKAVNSPIELLADEISLQHRLRNGKSKDVAASGGLTAAMAG